MFRLRGLSTNPVARKSNPISFRRKYLHVSVQCTQRKILYFRGALLLYTMAEPACSGTTLLYVCKQCRMSYCGLAAHRVLDEGACRQCFYLSKAAAKDPSLAIGSSAAGDPSPAIGSSAAGGHPNFVEASQGLGSAIPNMRKSRAQAVFA